MSSADGMQEKLSNFITSSSCEASLLDFVLKRNGLSRDFLQLFESFLENKYKKLVTFEEKLNFLRTLIIEDMSKLVTNFYQIENKNLGQMIDKCESQFDSEMRPSRQSRYDFIYILIFFIAIILLNFSGTPRKQEKLSVANNTHVVYMVDFASLSSKLSFKRQIPRNPPPAITYTQQTVAQVQQSSDSSANRSIITKNTQDSKKNVLVSQQNTAPITPSVIAKPLPNLKSTLKIEQVQQVQVEQVENVSQKVEARPQGNLVKAEVIRKSDSDVDLLMKILYEKIQDAAKSGIKLDLKNVSAPGDEKIVLTTTGTVGYFSANTTLNQHIEKILKNYPGVTAIRQEADHPIDRVVLYSLNMSIQDASSISLTKDLHNGKGNVGRYISEDIRSGNDLFDRTREVQKNYYLSVSDQKAFKNGLNKRTMIKNLDQCIQHDRDAFR